MHLLQKNFSIDEQDKMVDFINYHGTIQVILWTYGFNPIALQILITGTSKREWLEPFYL